MSPTTDTLASSDTKGRVYVARGRTFASAPRGAAPSKEDLPPIADTAWVRAAKVRRNIAETVRARIADGALQPRRPLTRSLGNEFGVSDATVRSALRPLIAEGLLEVPNNLGICLPGPPRKPAPRQKRQYGTVLLPGTSSRTVYDELLKMLDREQYRPGTQLPRYPELSRQFGVTLYAVAGGVKALEAQGRLHVSPQAIVVLGEGYTPGPPPIARVVRERIANGEIEPMRNIVAGLATEFRVREWKIRAALAPLVEEGLLLSRRGVGTFLPRRAPARTESAPALQQAYR